MANCEELRSMLAAYADGQLEPIEADAVEVHLAQCGRCRQIVVDQRRIQHVLGAYQPPPVAEPRWAEMGRRLRAELEGKGPRAVLKTRSRTETLEPTPLSQTAIQADELEAADEGDEAETPKPAPAPRAAKKPGLTVLRVRPRRRQTRYGWVAHVVGALAACIIIAIGTSPLWMEPDLGPIALAGPQEVHIMDVTMTDPNYNLVVDSGDACDVAVVWVVPNAPQG